MRSFVFVVAASALAVVFGCSDPPKKPGSCTGDKDCKAPQVCDANKCVECKSDAQCTGGKKCKANACVVDAECTKDSDCKPDGRVCQAGKCKACAADAECAGGACQAGLCSKPTKCTQDTDCKDDEDCIDGFCKRAGVGSTNPPDVSCTLSTVYFGFDDSTIQQSERDRLDGNAQCIEKTKNKQIFLFGHTDTSGTEEYNIALSERRAQSVADYLARLGADPARLQVVPKGETEPTGLGDDKDRRCDFAWK
jgi:peptidoglycan-associated lipoprotein